MDVLTRRLPPAALPQTPALVVDAERLDRNLAAMQAACDSAGVALRAHGKMHKSSAIGRRQVAAGAVGLCCQTVGEAEAFARAGVRDLLVTAPVPAWGAPRLAALAAGGASIAAVADSAAQIRRLSDSAVAAGTSIGLVVDIDLGQHRAGVAPSGAATLVRLAVSAPGLVWRGLQCYLGHLQHAADRADAHARAMAALGALVAELRAAGLAPAVVTGGGTGTAPLDLAAGIFTELQAGSYAFMDAQYAAAGATHEPALLLATTVVSAVHKSHVTVDAGLKALAADGPPPRVMGGAPDGSIFVFQGDEHGAIVHPAAWPRLKAAGPGGFLAEVEAIDADPAFAAPADAPGEGDLVWLQPGHVDPTVNLHDALWLLGADGGLERVAIDARRTSPREAVACA